MNLQPTGENSLPSRASDASPVSPGATRRPVVLSIAGFDPCSGAGVTADLKVFSAFSLYGMACVTALTVQSTAGVRRVEPVAVATIWETLEMLSEDVEFAGIKIGMLGSAAVAVEVARFVAGQKNVPVVLDPVLWSTSGLGLLEGDGLRVMKDQLLPVISWVTPNMVELGVLTGRPAASKKNIPGAAERLRDTAVRSGNDRLNVLVTGGDLDPPEDYLLTAAREGHWIAGNRVNTNATHGTGCALSSALLSRLVLGDRADVAAAHAKAYVESALRAAYPVGRGHGPMHHLFALETPVIL